MFKLQLKTKLGTIGFTRFVCYWEMLGTKRLSITYEMINFLQKDNSRILLGCED